MKTGRNVIEVLQRYGEDKTMAYAFTYAFLFVLDTADSHIFEARDMFKKNKPELFKHELKQLLNSAYNNIHSLMEIVKQYTKDDVDDVLLCLDDYQDRFNQEIFILYNVMLRQNASRYFKHDYELAKVCTKLDMGHILLEYWERLNNRVLSSMPNPLCETTNNYDKYSRACAFALRSFVTHRLILPDINVERLTPQAEKQFQGAFKRFLSSVTCIFNEMKDGKQDSTKDSTTQPSNKNA